MHTRVQMAAERAGIRQGCETENRELHKRVAVAFLQIVLEFVKVSFLCGWRHVPTTTCNHTAM